jgi:hypothetical protein
MNKSQQRILSHWPALLKAFLRAEWRSAAVSYSSGVLVGSSLAFLKTKAGLCADLLLKGGQIRAYQEVATLYAPYLWFMLGPVGLILLLQAASATWRAAKSWLFGITSGSCFWPLVIAAWTFSNISAYSVERGIISLGVTCLALLLGFALRLASAARSEETVPVGALNLEKVQRASYTVRDPESPIESLQEDTLGRSAFVEMLALKILVSKTPVIALRGNFGDGKSSALNMLHQQISSRAIVVSFSTWLPDSQQTLVTDLLDDIAAEIRKHFVVPGLRKQLRKFASLLAGSVPYLKALPDILPPFTQRQEIADLGALLGRIPKRVVVLLDEIDRMQREELLTLLKVIRGASSLPNLTFVCAFNQEQVEKIACGVYDANSHEFMEKFFPTGIDLPKPSRDVLRPMLRDQLLQSFDRVDWFRDTHEREDFVEGFDRLWDAVLFRVCTNIRKIGLLANDIHAAAVLVKGEVDPLDLSALEALRRFHPRAYEIVWTNASFFANSGEWWKSLSYRPTALVEAQKQKISEAIKKLSDEGDDESVIQALLTHMFPERAEELFGGQRLRAGGSGGGALQEAEKRKRIFHPDYFPVYFCRAVPEAVFSSLEMEKLKSRLQRPASDAERRTIFSHTLDSLERGSLRQYDYVHKVALELERLPIDVAQSVSFAIASNADKFGDEPFVNESNRALAGVFAVAQRLSGSERINSFLADCINLAATNLFAARLYVFMTTRREKNGVVKEFAHVDDSQLQRAFTKRMDDRYGPNADVTVLVLAIGDVYAFSLWAGISPAERVKEVAFWQRYIGTSRRRLAEVFNLIAPRDELWTKESPDFIDQMIPTELLRGLDGELAQDGQLEQPDEEALNRLKRFLKGELKYGEVLGESGSRNGDLEEAANGSARGSEPGRDAVV